MYGDDAVDREEDIAIIGPRTGDLHGVWTSLRPWHPSTKEFRADTSTLPLLFHQLQLYPTKAQVYEMLHTASLCSKRGSEDLSFGEFAFFATELRHVYDHGSPAIIHSRLKAYKPRRLDRRLSRSAVQYDVFLGGSCNPTTWRRDLAIPQFKKKGITYYNPQVPSWRPEFIELEHQAKLGASLLLFVIDNRTRGTASVIEAAYLAATGRRLLLVIIPFAGPGQIVCGEPISEREYEDLKHGQVVLTDLVERQSLPVFSSVQHALDIAPDLLRAGEHPCDLGPSSIVTPVRMGHVVLGDRLMKLRDAFDALDSQGTGKLNLNEVSMAFRIISHRNLSPAEISALMEMPSARSVPLKIVEEGNKYMFPPTPSSEGITPPPSPPLPPDKENTDGKAAYSRSNFSNQASLEVDFDAFCAMVAEFRNPETTRSVSSVREESLSSSVRLTVTSALCGGSSILPHRPTPNPFRRMSTLGDLFGKASSYTLQVLKPLQKAIGWVPSSPTTNGPPSPTSRHPHQRPSYARDVYLGGSMGHTTWRKAVAIPLLKKRGITYYNPCNVSRRERMTPMEMRAIDSAKVLLFVISDCTRSLASMCTAAYYVGLGCNVVLCIQKIPKNLSIDGEKLSHSAIQDYNRGRSYLSDLANREGVPVFESIEESLECVVRKCLDLSE